MSAGSTLTSADESCC